VAIGGFALVNCVTALSSHYGLTLVARFFAGVFAGLLWALLAGYASRMVAPHLQGRAIAVAMLGAPLALSLGVPAGTFLGAAVGWRLSFAIMTGLTLLLLIWARLQLPDFAGEQAGKRLGLHQVVALPGIRPVLWVTFTYVLAHNILYTYIAPLLVPAGIAADVDRVLLVFGLAALLSIWLAGVLIDRWLRTLLLISCALFGLIALALALWIKQPVIIYLAVALWGLAFGGLPALLQPPRWTWVLVLALVIVCRAAALTANASTATLITIAGMPFAAYLGCGLARHLAMGDARLLSWGEDGLVPVTRDLLLGRVTSGMLHDLAQPLNVISMANGNMGYIIDQLDIDPQAKANLADRIARISTHTEGAAHILGLFRGFGRDGGSDLSQLKVRNALERALAATKSNVRHHGVAVALSGDGLEHPVPAHHGALEMMAVAALLNAFSAFLRPDGTKRKGEVRIMARLGPAFVSITVQCFDEAGQPLAGPMLDHATLWLVEQVAVSASGDFRCDHRAGKGTRFLIRLGRDDI
jgi:predicted MFS family arabinose efflux permease